MNSLKMWATIGVAQVAIVACAEIAITVDPATVVGPIKIMNAVNKGLTILKFFPAGVFGGLKALKAMSAAFPGIRFLPTGGVDETNAPEFLAQKFIVGVGGSWMMKGTAEDIENACRRAAQLVK